MKLKYLPLFGAVFTAGSIQAEDIQDRWVEKEKSKWSSILSVDYSWTDYDSDLLISDKALTNRTASAYAIVRYSLDKDTRLQAIVSGYRAIDTGPGAQTGEFMNDAWLSYSRNNLWNPTEHLKMSGEARIAIPLSKRSERTNLDTAVRLGLRFSLNLSDHIEGLYLSDYVRIQKNFHQYSTAGGIHLNEYQLSNIVAIDYYFADKWSLSYSAMYRYNWEYSKSGRLDISNKKPIPTILHSLQVGYQLTNDMDISLGLTNSASHYRVEEGPNPLDELTDLSSSSFYLSMNYLF